MKKTIRLCGLGMIISLSLSACVGASSDLQNTVTKNTLAHQSLSAKFQVQTFYTDDIKYSKAIYEGSPYSLVPQFTADIDDNGIIGGQIISRNTINPRYDSKMHYYRIGRESGDTQDYIISYDFPADSRLENCFYADCGLNSVRYLGGRYFSKYWDKTETGEKLAISLDGNNTNFNDMKNIDQFSSGGKYYSELKSVGDMLTVTLYDLSYPRLPIAQIIVSSMPGVSDSKITQTNDRKDIIINLNKNRTYPQAAIKIDGTTRTVASIASADYDNEELQMQVLSNDSQYIYGFAIDHSFSTSKLYALVLYKQGAGLKYLYNIPSRIQADIKLQQVTNEGDLYITSGNNNYIYSTLQNKYFDMNAIINYIGVTYISPHVQFSSNGKFMIITGYLPEGMAIKGKLVTKVTFEEGLDQFLQQNINPVF